LDVQTAKRKAWVMTILDYAGYFILLALLGAGWIIFGGRDD
jgi:hypothetical protein